ncbi:hypothetical protein D3C84_1203170 [compost metagenome]
MNRVSSRLASTTQNTSTWSVRVGISQLIIHHIDAPRTGMPSMGQMTNNTLVTTT